MRKKYDVTKHILVAKHSKVSEKEKKELLEKRGITLKQLPKISKKDPAIAHLNVAVGSIVKVTRKSSTAGESIFYRGVVNV